MQERAVSPSLAVPTEDTVFMRDENERREYVLSQHGLIYQGTCDYIYSIPWNFGQVSGQGLPGPLGPLADPGHAALVLQDTGTGATCVPLTDMHPKCCQHPGGQPGVKETGISFPRGNALTSKCGKARGVFPRGSWGPHGRVFLIGVALLCQESIPDNAFLGTVPGVPIRQCPHPEQQPPGHRGCSATLPEQRAECLQEWGCPWPPQDPRLNSRKGCDSAAMGNRFSRRSGPCPDPCAVTGSQIQPQYVGRRSPTGFTG